MISDLTEVIPGRVAHSLRVLQRVGGLTRICSQPRTRAIWSFLSNETGDGSDRLPSARFPVRTHAKRIPGYLARLSQRRWQPRQRR